MNESQSHGSPNVEIAVRISNKTLQIFMKEPKDAICLKRWVQRGLLIGTGYLMQSRIEERKQLAR